MKSKKFSPKQIALIIFVVLVAIVSYRYAAMKKTAQIQTPPLDLTTSTWQTYTDPSSNIAFKYPKDLPTTYIHTVDWPPKVQISDEPFTCTEAGSEIAPAGKTESRMINGHMYCVTIESEGAAGSIYNNYAYAVEKDNKLAIFTFSLREVQCDNYDDPNKTACKDERATFTIDYTLDHMAESLTGI